jgi:sec-independent protein translocase protein TatB
VLGGLGWPETAVLIVLRLFRFGPDRLPGLAADAGRMLRKVRRWLTDVGDDLKAELGPEVADLDLRSLDPREIVRRHLLEDDDEEELPRRRRVLAPGERPPWDPDTT